jgi:Rps23 Pro-64 3,4-dihydroxylase Tpa1-like proline 4-hydroxylase
LFHTVRSKKFKKEKDLLIPLNTNALSNTTHLAEIFASAKPFPHVVIENFLDNEFATVIHDEVRATVANINASNDITQKRKVACTDWNLFGENTFKLISFFNSAAFISYLEEITGISGLLPDPWLEGGGIHQTWRGGFLKMHTDFNWNEKLRADRRINILLYLNKDWLPEYGGELVLKKVDEDTQKSFPPLFNRLIIFNTNDTTLHGQPHPLKFPETYPRASIALYYYTSGLKVRERMRRRATTTRYLPLEKGDIDLSQGSIRSRLGYLLRRFTRM